LKHKKTLVLGASSNPQRYSYLAMKSLLNHKHPVVAIGRKNEQILSVDVKNTQEKYDDIDTVTLYLNPQNQKAYYEYIIGLKPQRIIFNPGTEIKEFQLLANNSGIQTIVACTLVLLSTGQY
jgi:predicted CoA-binding protein